MIAMPWGSSSWRVTKGATSWKRMGSTSEIGLFTPSTMPRSIDSYTSVQARVRTSAPRWRHAFAASSSGCMRSASPSTSARLSTGRDETSTR